MKIILNIVVLLALTVIGKPLFANESIRFNPNAIFVLQLPTNILAGSIVSPLDDILIDLKDLGSIHIETFLNSDEKFNGIDMRQIPRYLLSEKNEIKNSKVQSDLDSAKKILMKKFNKTYTVDNINNLIFLFSKLISKHKYT